MASKTAQPATYAEKLDEMAPAWVYQVPGAILIVAGFGGLVALSFL